MKVMSNWLISDHFPIVLYCQPTEVLCRIKKKPILFIDKEEIDRRN